MQRGTEEDGHAFDVRAAYMGNSLRDESFDGDQELEGGQSDGGEQLSDDGGEEQSTDDEQEAYWPEQDGEEVRKMERLERGWPAEGHPRRVFDHGDWQA